MDHNIHTTTADSTDVFKQEDVLCRIATSGILESVASYPKPLQQIGFTGIVLPDGVDGNIEAITQLGLGVHSEENTRSRLDLAEFSSDSYANASVIWSQLQRSPTISIGVELTSGQRSHEATTLLQMSTPPVPIVPVDDQLLYASDYREQRELLRSAVFWRKRFDILRHSPNLVHAGEDGLLIYTVDSWLVSINQNPEESTIDLGSHGSMWLMLGTLQDVHLHGSMLILPAFSGAVVANELAR